MRRFIGEFWRRFGWMFLVAGILIGAGSAETMVDLIVTLVFVVLLAVWLVRWMRRKRAMAKVEKV